MDSKVFIRRHGIVAVCGERLVCPECGASWAPSAIYDQHSGPTDVAITLRRVTGETANDFIPEADGALVHVADCTCMRCTCQWSEARLGSEMEPEWGLSVDGNKAPAGEQTPEAQTPEGTADAPAS